MKKSEPCQSVRESQPSANQKERSQPSANQDASEEKSTMSQSVREKKAAISQSVSEEESAVRQSESFYVTNKGTRPGATKKQKKNESSGQKTVM